VKKVRSLLLFRLSQFENKKGSMPAFLAWQYCLLIRIPHFCFAGFFTGGVRGTPAFQHDTACCQPSRESALACAFTAARL